MVDAVIEYHDGRIGALEVVGDHDAAFNELWAVLEKQDHETEIVGLQRGWAVQLGHNARIGTVRSALPELLARLEEADLRNVRLAVSGAHRELWREAKRLRLKRIVSDDDMASGQVRFYTEGWSGITGSITPAEWLEWVLSDNADVSAKLLAHEGAAERHAFVWATIGTDYAVQAVLENRDAAVHLGLLGPPRLRDGITHAWIAGGMSTLGGLLWSADEGWRRVNIEHQDVAEAVE